MHRAIHTQMAPRKGIFMICKMVSLEAIFILKRDTEMLGEGWREYGSSVFLSGGSDPIVVYPLSAGCKQLAFTTIFHLKIECLLSSYVLQ